MATDDYLADPEDLAAWLGVPADNPKLLRALASASSRFRGQVRHYVSRVTGDTVRVDGTGRRSFLLPAAPVVELTSLELDGTALVEGAGFEWSEDGFVRRAGGCLYWPDRLRCIQVVYSHGYDPVPEDISEVVIDQARSQYTVRPGIQTMQVGGQQVGFGAQASVGVTTQWTAMVDKYRLDRGDDP
ncbi:mobile element protein [Streptomyces olivaceus]|uniref:mobile element protein n=1 Tax=Streptomyces olivaceus TaxID=47716 RepID=UPI001CCBCEA8|nr:mobile element protein [Streptomyces olivaceus]MBZ6258862.1 mobile element protein [Streptomyces olivaceus]